MQPYPKTRREIERHSAAKRMKRLVFAFRNRVDDALRDSGVTTAQVRLLHELDKQPGTSGAELARTLHVTPQSAQAQLARAVAHGWVVRGTHEGNHRLVSMQLTRAGSRLLDQVYSIAAEVERQMWTGVVAADIQVLNRVLERALQNLEE